VNSSNVVAAQDGAGHRPEVLLRVGENGAFEGGHREANEGIGFGTRRRGDERLERQAEAEGSGTSKAGDDGDGDIEPLCQSAQGGIAVERPAQERDGDGTTEAAFVVGKHQDGPAVAEHVGHPPGRIRPIDDAKTRIGVEVGLPGAKLRLGERVHNDVERMEEPGKGQSGDGRVAQTAGGEKAAAWRASEGLKTLFPLYRDEAAPGGISEEAANKDRLDPEAGGVLVHRRGSGLGITDCRSRIRCGERQTGFGKAARRGVEVVDSTGEAAGEAIGEIDAEDGE